MRPRNRILVLEDSLPLQEELVRALKTLSPDLRIDCATSVDEVDLNSRSGRFRLDSLYDLVISDVILSGEMSGIEFWALCEREFPLLKFVLMSGMDRGEYLREIRTYHRKPPRFLQKPFTPGECRAVVEELIYG